jgi:hypothetical protein
MEEDCIASQGPQRTVALEKKKKKFPDDGSSKHL